MIRRLREAAVLSGRTVSELYWIHLKTVDSETTMCQATDLGTWQGWRSRKREHLRRREIKRQQGLLWKSTKYTIHHQNIQKQYVSWFSSLYKKSAVSGICYNCVSINTLWKHRGLAGTGILPFLIHKIKHQFTQNESAALVRKYISRGLPSSPVWLVSSVSSALQALCWNVSFPWLSITWHPPNSWSQLLHGTIFDSSSQCWHELSLWVPVTF